MGRPAARGLQSSLRPLKLQVRQQRDQDVKGNRMNCASYVRIETSGKKRITYLHSLQSSSENRHYSFSFWLQLRRIRTLSFSLCRALFSQISHPPVVFPEAGLHSSRP